MVYCAMPRKPKPQPDNPEQFKRFIATAREVRDREPVEHLERVFDKIATPKRDAAARPKRSK